MDVNWTVITALIVLGIAIGAVFVWREIKRRRGGDDGSRAKLRGEILELYCNAPYPPKGADYALVLRLKLTSFPPIETAIEGYRLETVCAGVPYESTVLHDASYWMLIQETAKIDRDGHRIIGTDQTVLDDFHELVSGNALPHNREMTAWLAFLYIGMFKRIMDFQPPESFDVYRTRLVLTDSGGREHRFAVRPDFTNRGILGQSP